MGAGVYVDMDAAGRIHNRPAVPELAYHLLEISDISIPQDRTHHFRGILPFRRLPLPACCLFLAGNGSIAHAIAVSHMTEAGSKVPRYNAGCFLPGNACHLNLNSKPLCPHTLFLLAYICSLDVCVC